MTTPTLLPSPAALPFELRPTLVPADTDHSQCVLGHTRFDGRRLWCESESCIVTRCDCRALFEGKGDSCPECSDEESV